MRNLKAGVLAIIMFLPLVACAGSAKYKVTGDVKPLLGEWEGPIQIKGAEIGMLVKFFTENDTLKASIDIPMQGAYGLKLEGIQYDGQKIHFELPTQISRAVYDGTLKEKRIEGVFKQGAANGTFFLEPSKKDATPPPPYKEEEVSVKVNEQVTLAGTLSIPDGAGPFPAVLMITGSGSQDRNEDVLGFKVFKVISDHLSRKGIAVLRCDDRGAGKSTGDRTKATSRDFYDDAVAQFEYLKTRPEIDPENIGIIGHSEGGIIAPMVASEHRDVAFIVMMAGPAVKGEELLKEQAAMVAKAEGRSEENIKENLVLQQKVLDAIKSGTGFDELREEIRKAAIKEAKAMPKEERSALGNINKYAKNVADAQMEFIKSPWMKYFVEYDPRPTLAKVDCRVLAFFGKLDVQVPAESQSKELEKVFKDAGKENYLIKICCQANHLFQPAKTGAVSEYAKLPKEFTPCFLPTVTAWILEQPIPDECDHAEKETPSAPSDCPSNEKPSSGCGGCPYEKLHNK